MRVDCRVAGRYITVNYCECCPSAGVRVRELDTRLDDYDFYFVSFEEFHKLIYHILEMNTHEGFLNEKK